jgi:hypothetical protein
MSSTGHEASNKSEQVVNIGRRQVFLKGLPVDFVIEMVDLGMLETRLHSVYRKS